MSATAKPADRTAPPELHEIERLLAAGGSALQRRVVCEVAVGATRLPVHAITLGNPSRDVPGLGIFGGVHGLERIGAEVAIAFLATLVERLRWDATLHWMLAGLRIIVMPLVNPGGLWLGTRANPHGVDLMRNGPTDAAGPVPPLVGGHRLGPRLPWYRGPAGAAMEDEARALCDVVAAELLGRPFALTVDCHSGFGLRDRLWFPFAHTRVPIRHLPEVNALAELLDRTHPQHHYLVEPQSRHYLAHGDLWDHLYQRALALGDSPLLPLTLEMGSWLWVKKNPRQALSRLGLFNPLIGHRQQRVLRRQVGWLEVLARATLSHARWQPRGPDRAAHRERALQRWYRVPRG